MENLLLILAFLAMPFAMWLAIVTGTDYLRKRWGIKGPTERAAQRARKRARKRAAQRVLEAEVIIEIHGTPRSAPK